MIFVNMGSSSSRHNFSSQVGIGSISQDLFGDLCIIRFTSSSEAVVKVSKQVTAVGWSGSIFPECESDCGWELIPVLMSSILLMKKSLKSWASSVEDLLAGRVTSSVLPSRFLVILNKFF